MVHFSSFSLSYMAFYLMGKKKFKIINNWESASCLRVNSYGRVVGVKKLQKSKDNEILFGVLGGIAEYFEIDPVLVRVIFFVLAVGSMGTFILIYIALAIIMPDEPEEVTFRKRREKIRQEFDKVNRRDYRNRERKQAEDVEEVDEDDWSDF